MSELIFEREKTHSSIFLSTLTLLSKTNIRYIVLQGDDVLSNFNQNMAREVNIIIEPGTFKRVKSLFFKTLRDNNISNYYQTNLGCVYCCYGIDVDKKFSIRINFLEGYCRNGYEFISFEDLYAYTIEYNGIRILNEDYVSCIFFMYKIIGGDQLNEKYYEKIFNSFSLSNSKCHSVIKKMLGESLGSRIVDQIQYKQFDVILSHTDEINKVAKRRAFLRSPGSTLTRMTKLFLKKIENVVICPFKRQHLIAVEAPDGTGKTTFIDVLGNKISEYFVSDIDKTRVYHFRPTILANLGAVGEKTGVMKQDKDFTNPHRAKPVNPFSSFFRFIYYWIDYVIGVPIIVRKCAPFDYFPIFDRYIYDFIVDPARTRINLPKWIRTLFSHLVKQPQIIFVLNTSAEIIYKRKQELEENEIHRQIVEFRSLKDEFSNVYLLDAGQTPEEIAMDAIRIIVDKFTKKIQ